MFPAISVRMGLIRGFSWHTDKSRRWGDIAYVWSRILTSLRSQKSWNEDLHWLRQNRACRHHLCRMSKLVYSPALLQLGEPGVGDSTDSNYIDRKRVNVSWIKCMRRESRSPVWLLLTCPGRLQNLQLTSTPSGHRRVLSTQPPSLLHEVCQMRVALAVFATSTYLPFLEACSHRLWKLYRRSFEQNRLNPWSPWSSSRLAPLVVTLRFLRL